MVGHSGQMERKMDGSERTRRRKGDGKKVRGKWGRKGAKGDGKRRKKDGRNRREGFCAVVIFLLGKPVDKCAFRVIISVIISFVA